MTRKNKLNLTDSAALAREEERLSKQRAKELYDEGLLDTLTPGAFSSLAEIHRRLFGDLSDFAGEVRTENLAKATFALRRFCT